MEDEIGLKEYCATFLFVLFLEQHKAFPNQIHTLISDDTLKYSDILASISPFYNTSTQLLHMGGRIGMGASGRRDKEFFQNHSTHYKLVLPHKAQLTKLVALNAHQRHQCASPAFVRLILNEQFYVPRATATIKSVLSKCTVCLLARNSLNRIEPPTGKVKAFRIPHSPEENGELNKPYRVAYYDFKGSIRVRDDRSFKNFDKNSTQPSDPQMLKICILSMTCAL